MTSRRIAAAMLAAALLALACTAVAKKKNDTRALIEHARATVESGIVDPARDVQPVLDALSATTNKDDADDLLSAVRDLGDYESTFVTAAVKNYVRDAAPPVLLRFAQGPMPGMQRSQTLSLLRSLNVSDAVLDQAIAICAADASADSAAMHQRADRLRSWKRAGSMTEVYYTLAPADPDAERRALKLLSSMRERVSPYGLGQAAGHGNPAVVEAMLDAGVPVNTRMNGLANALGEAAGTGCLDRGFSLERQLKVIDVLVARGIDVNPPNQGANSLLFEAARDCPAPIVKKLIDVGVKVERDPPGFAPLQIAMVSGKWDVAALLVDHGARLAKKQVDELFFEKPTDPSQIALLRRATGK